MKKPFLFDAAPLVTEIKPIRSQGIYDVFVGSVKEDSFPLYVVVNRDTGVVEFTHEVTGVITDWLNHFTSQPDLNNIQLNGEQLNLNLKN